MPLKRKGRKRARKSGRSGGLRWSHCLYLVVILSCVAAAGIAWLDFRIRAEFSGKKWALPARVYAEPIDLFSGQTLSPVELEGYISELGYKKVSMVRQVGEYRVGKAYLEIGQRPFDFWDGRRPGRTIGVRFSGNKIRQMQDLGQGRPLPLTRLEPMLVGRIYPGNFEDRILVDEADIPRVLVDALLAVEDRNYFQHIGIDPEGILRALYHNIFSGGIEQGGSTITQQLVKNFFLNRERTFTRKFNEIIMALLLERRFDKQTIFTAYVNEVYLGQQGKRSVHGFGAAAEFYFAAPLEELRPDQLALLVGMVKGASYYNPRRHPQRALARRNLALELMFQQGYLDEPTWQQARAMPLDVSERPRWVSGKYPAFLQLVKQELTRDYNMRELRTRGLRIFTTLDTRRQDATEQALHTQLQRLEQAKSLPTGSLQAASIFVESSSGAVLSLAGDRNADYTGFNRVLQARRPIGSLVKPFVYYAALARPQRYSILSRISDSAITVPLADGSSWRPVNYDAKDHGRVTLVEALAKSYNRATVRLGQEVGLPEVIAALRDAGVPRAMERYPSLLLGSLELTPLEVIQLYQTLANGGFQAPVTAIREVLDKDGKALRRYPLEVRQALQTEAAYLTAYMLVQAVRHGTGRGLNRMIPEYLPLAGKTGTTNDRRDSWFAGFDDTVTGVVWVGRDDNLSSRHTGASGAMRIWGNILRRQGATPVQLLPPPGLGTVEELAVPFAADCVVLRAVPYVLGARPPAVDEC